MAFTALPDPERPPHQDQVGIDLQVRPSQAQGTRIHPQDLSDDPMLPNSHTGNSAAADLERALPQDQSSSRSASTYVADKEPFPELDIEMPDKKYTRFLRNLRWTVFSVYRRLNVFVLTANILAMIVLGTQHKLLSMSPDSAATAV